MSNFKYDRKPSDDYSTKKEGRKKQLDQVQKRRAKLARKKSQG